MNRLGLTHPSTLTGKHNAETSLLYHAFVEHAHRHLDADHTTFRLPSTGALVGPFGILLHHPALGRAYLDFAKALHDLVGAALSPRLREVLALTVAAHERSAFQLYAHERLARRAGLSRNEVDSLRAGLFSTSFSGEDRAAYGLARELCVSSGPLSQRAWEDAIVAVGRRAAVAAVHLVAFQRYDAAILRGFDAQVPTPGERVENQAVAGSSSRP